MGFLRGGGRASELILACDWTDHPMGPPQGWPDAFKVALSALLNSPESMILCWGRDPMIFFFNEAYFPLLGPRVSWAMGGLFHEVWADAWAQAKPIIDEAFAGRPRRFVDLPWKLDTDRGQADTWWTFSYSRVLDPTGEIAGLLIFTNETTNKVLADRALAESQDELKALNATLEQRVRDEVAERERLWRTSPDLMVVVSSSGHYLRVNPAWTVVLGFDDDELVGRFATDLIHPDDVERTAQALTIAQAGTLPSFETRLRRKDGGYRWIQWSAASGAGEVFAVGRDVTAAKAVEAHLKRTEDQLRQAQKMEAVGQLTGGIAHDFNNMLTGVIGSLDILKRRIAEGRLDRAERYLDAAAQSAERAAGLTHRLLAFSRRQSLDVRAVDVNALVAGLEDLLRRTLGEAVELQVQAGANLWPAMSDPNQLESAILNLAINARDAMPDGGRLRIETGMARLDAEEGAEGGGEAGDFVRVAVTDTGEGMAPEILAKAFEPFFTTKPIGSGTGLGLSMIYGFARQSGGRVRLHSASGEGTTVELFLPRDRGAAVADPVPETKPGRTAEGEHILLIEDDPAVRMLVRDILEDQGYRVTATADGREARPILDGDARIDLVVSDVGLPGLNGRRLAEQARRSRPGLKVLFITGYAEGAAVRGDFLAEGMEMLDKPFHVDDLTARVAAMLG